MTQAPDVAAICERLREQGVDVVRVSYPDMIGVDRGRDVLLDELPTAAGHGLAFCRAVYHTSPMADVVPVQGGLEMGLPDITVYPDLTTLTPLPTPRTILAPIAPASGAVPASTTVTWQPLLAAAVASSAPLQPAPMIASRSPGRSTARSARASSSDRRNRCRPGPGSAIGRAPVAITSRSNE